MKGDAQVTEEPKSVETCVQENRYSEHPRPCRRQSHGCMANCNCMAAWQLQSHGCMTTERLHGCKLADHACYVRV